MPNNLLSAPVRETVMLRAKGCCEYCHSQDRYSPNLFTIDHILPKNLGGSDDSDNLAYACFLCNRLKSNKVSGFDPITKTQISIFNPRLDTWDDHFSWNEDYTLIIGISPNGRSTVNMLRLNREKLVAFRKALLLFGGHPPILV